MASAPLPHCANVVVARLLRQHRGAYSPAPHLPIISGRRYGVFSASRFSDFIIA